MKHLLYGDGIHDDTDAIQEMLDSGEVTISLPQPADHYAISRTLRIHSGQTLTLPLMARIRLLPGSSCRMLENDLSGEEHDISVIGGIWDMDNTRQNQNPYPYTCKDEKLQYKGPFYGNGDKATYYAADQHTGCCMMFSHITRFRISDVTFRNPTTFGMQACFLKYFTIENIQFDYTTWNPRPLNMDGVHLDGGCCYGHIRNLQGRCYDDLLALNADDFLSAPITDISVDGVYGEDTLRAVRLLSAESEVSRISVRNVFGSYYGSAIVLSRFYNHIPGIGNFGILSFENIHARSSCPEDVVDKERWNTGEIIRFEGRCHIRSLNIRNLSRYEDFADIPTIHVKQDVVIHRLSIENTVQQVKECCDPAFLHNNGTIQNLRIRDLDINNPHPWSGEGTLEKADVPEELAELFEKKQGSVPDKN